MKRIQKHISIAGLASTALGVLVVILACDAPPPPQPVAAPAPAQCGKDSDCKGDRICDSNGKCVSPH